MVPICKVDENGVGINGEDFTNVATDEMVDQGFMVNRPVLLQYPDGSMVESTQVFVTQSGLEFLRRQVPLELRETSGAA